MSSQAGNIGRIYDNKTNIDESSIKQFFIDRANKYDDQRPAISMLYQDKNPSLAEKRDFEEKKLLLPLIAPSLEDKVLDIGCGIGRWADVLSPNVSYYHGIDMMKELIDIAQKRCFDFKNRSFQTLPAQDVSPSTLNTSFSFNIIMIAGVLHYINDEDVEKILSNINKCAALKTKIVIRGPFALEKRLTLNKIWSDELEHEYSAIYRTIDEMHELFKKHLSDFSVIKDSPLFPSELNNRKETEQHFFILQKE